jgi:hypothetical protein
MVNNEFIEVKYVDNLFGIISEFSKDSVIFLDVDDTLITPLSTTFRRPPYNRLIEEIKNNKEDYFNFMEIVSNWRLQRKAILLDKKWPEIINKLKERFVVYGLTKMDIGRFGNIESMEKWRINELRSFGINFSDNTKIPEGNIGGASFYHGIFMTGSNTKAQTLDCYLQYFPKQHIVLVDDKVGYLRDVQNFCFEHFIKFTGILFEGLQELSGCPNPDIAAIQKRYLIEKAQWLEDDQAEKLLKIGGM